MVLLFFPLLASCEPRDRQNYAEALDCVADASADAQFPYISGHVPLPADPGDSPHRYERDAGNHAGALNIPSTQLADDIRRARDQGSDEARRVRALGSARIDDYYSAGLRMHLQDCDMLR